jgi:hypothetical protein
MMPFLLWKAYANLLYFDFCLARGNFPALYGKVRSCAVEKNVQRSDAIEQICSAMDLACIWYWKKVLCLQRSAATACLLKRHGVPAQMVIGVQQMPFRAHAWVEVYGQVVNDRPYTAGMYAVIDKC